MKLIATNDPHENPRKDKKNNAEPVSKSILPLSPLIIIFFTFVFDWSTALIEYETYEKMITKKYALLDRPFISPHHPFPLRGLAVIS